MSLSWILLGDPRLKVWAQALVSNRDRGLAQRTQSYHAVLGLTF